MSNKTPNGIQGPPGFHVMAKPVGPVCNLRCEYCFYLEKEALFPDGEKYRMSDEVLEAYIRKNIASQDPRVPEILFAWQGGEPTMLGVDFFRKAVDLERKYAPRGKAIVNTFQTNGTLLNDEWCRFLKTNNFLIGLSLDGPREIHDRYRVDRSGGPTFDRVMRGLDLLKRHGVDFNVLACVNEESSGRPRDVYRFLKGEGVKFIQFIPIVERLPDPRAEELGLDLAVPPALDMEDAWDAVTPWTVRPEHFGDFMIGVFDEWVRNDVGDMYVMNFEWTLAAFAGLPGVACFFMNRCGRAVIIEHNGDIYSCDHFMYPDYRLGNILTDDLARMVNSDKQVAFGALKETTLPRYCRECDVLFACRGACPKHRFLKSPHGEPGLNYLCEGYKKFFNHVRPYMNVMIQLMERGLPAHRVMEALKGPILLDPEHGGGRISIGE
ncbi:MAG: anaerobic sulfatase maturase [bacterium]